MESSELTAKKAMSVKSVRDQLANYRSQKAKEQRQDRWKECWYKPWQLMYSGDDNIMETPQHLLESKSTITDETEESSASNASMTQTTSTPSFFYRLHFQLPVLLILWILAISVEFGAVFFALAIFYILWSHGFSSSRSGDRTDGQDSGPSAYSVFNENCQRLEGTFTGEDFDRGLRSGFRA